jgi:hypothetical protein
MSQYLYFSIFGSISSRVKLTRGDFQRAAGPIIFIAVFSVLCASDTLAQNCDTLIPSGGDDAININHCLSTQGRATLSGGYTFEIYQPIQAIQIPGARLTGAGRASTRVLAKFSCGDSRFVVSGSYKTPVEFRRSPNSVISGFHLDLEELRKSCGHQAGYAVVVNRSEGTQVTGLKITGSEYGTPDYTTGWSHGGGILVLNSAQSTVIDNVIKNVGFTNTIGGNSAGSAGIQINSSYKSKVEYNEVRRVAFGIEVVNGSPSQGFTGDSSETTVIGNQITGAAQVGCSDCALGRAIKFQACGVGDELPIRKSVVRYNDAINFGGRPSGPGGTGLHLTCGVQYGVFENNFFTGAPNASWGVLIDSTFGTTNPSHHNTFNNNYFKSGRFSGYCDSNCYDLEFNTSGPDQVGLGAGNVGTNTLGTASKRDRYSNQCSQYGSAWFNYPSGQNFIYRGQYLLVTGAGIRPPSFFAVITFRFKNSSGVEVATYQTQRSNSNCVVNQEYFYINPAVFAPGLYTVTADYYDGTADLFIRGDAIGTLDVR